MKNGLFLHLTKEETEILLEALASACEADNRFNFLSEDGFKMLASLVVACDEYLGGCKGGACVVETEKE